MWDTLILNPMINALLWIYALLGQNFGMAIIMFTIVIRLVTIPLTLQQQRSQQKMSEMQGSKRWQEIQKKYKDDKQKLQEEQLKLYREVGFNPMSGCLPTLIQLPIILTNITHEHLDYHGCYESYLCEAKGRLIRMLAQTPLKTQDGFRSAILNRDDSSFEYLANLIGLINTGNKPPVQMVTYGMHPGVDCTAENIRLDSDGMNFQATARGKVFTVESNLSGAFNVSNCLAAIAATAIGLDIPLEAVQTGI